MRCAVFVFGCLVLLGLGGSQTPAPPRQTAAVRLTLSALVTTMEGKPIAEAWVKASGPVDREGATDPSGTATFINITAGSYRLRFEHEQFVTLERDVTVLAGKPLKVSVALNAAPPPAPPPKVEAPAPPPPVTPPPGSYQTTVVSLGDWIDANFIGRAPSKHLAAGCSTSTSSTMVQTNEPVADHAHADGDEIIYVVAGEGTLRTGGRDLPITTSSLITIPRGTAHSLVRRGSRPLVFVSTVSGPLCQPGK